VQAPLPSSPSREGNGKPPTERAGGQLLHRLVSGDWKCSFILMLNKRMMHENWTKKSGPRIIMRGPYIQIC